MYFERTVPLNIEQIEQILTHYDATEQQHDLLLSFYRNLDELEQNRRGIQKGTLISERRQVWGMASTQYGVILGQRDSFVYVARLGNDKEMLRRTPWVEGTVLEELMDAIFEGNVQTPSLDEVSETLFEAENSTKYLQ